ncbi:MAG: hypothetical protein ACRC1H_14320, partial [Caldilineaceae bacterium]
MLGNASANVARIVINAVAAVLLPRILLGTLTAEEYSVWVLIVQISLYSGYLDVGFSTVVGRMVAHLKEKGDLQRLNAIVSSGLALMVILALVACFGILVAVIAFDRLFPDVPAQLQQQASLALLMVGIVTAFRLPFWILGGVFIGLQRNEFPLAFNLVNRAVVLVACWVAARLDGGLLAVALAYSLATMATNAAELVAYLRFVPGIRVSLRAISRSALREIGSNSIGFGVWQVSILLVSGLDLLIVGKWDFASVAAYSFGLTLVSFVRQVQSSSVSVAMPVAAVLSGRDDRTRLNDLLLSSTRLGA